MIHLVLAASLLAAPLQPTASTLSQEAAAPTPTASAAQSSTSDVLFPTPTGPLQIAIGDPESKPTMLSIVKAYGELTGQHFIYDIDTEQLLRHGTVNMDRSMTVPVDEVQTTFEHLLRSNDFVMLLLKEDGQRLLKISSLATAARSNIRSNATFLDPKNLDTAKAHPALLFTTVVHLPNTDVRQASNSMRTMITDANTQQLLPAGNSNSMVIVGFGDSVHATAAMLRQIDDAAAIGKEEREPAMIVVKLEKAIAADTVSLLDSAYGIDPKERLYGQPKFLADERTNSLLITAPTGRLEGITHLIHALDQ